MDRGGERADLPVPLGSIPERASIKDQLTRIWNYPKYNVPTKRGKDYFFTENSGLQNQAVLYVQHGLKGARKMVLDPNTLSTDGTVALGVWDATENGKYLAYAVAAAGSDWEEIRVRDVEKGTDLSDTLKWVKFSNIAWTKDHKGFFYSRFEEPKSENALLAKNTGQKLYYHYVGEPQAKDRLIYERPDHPQWTITATVSDDGEYVIIYVSDGTNPNNRIFFIDVSNPGKPKIDNPLVTLIDDEESRESRDRQRGRCLLPADDAGRAAGSRGRRRHQQAGEEVLAVAHPRRRGQDGATWSSSAATSWCTRSRMRTRCSRSTRCAETVWEA